MKRICIALLACLLATPLAACEAAVDQCIKDAVPADCVQAEGSDSHVAGYAASAVAGYAAARMLSPNQPSTRVERRTYIVSPPKSAAAPRQSFTPRPISTRSYTTYRPSSFRSFSRR